MGCSGSTDRKHFSPRKSITKDTLCYGVTNYGDVLNDFPQTSSKVNGTYNSIISYSKTLCSTNARHEHKVTIFDMTYHCQCYRNIRRGCPTGDHKSGLMSVDAQSMRSSIIGLYKWLLGIWEIKKSKQKAIIWWIFPTDQNRRVNGSVAQKDKQL